MESTGITTMGRLNKTKAAEEQVADGVIERIERLITHGILKVGEPLPSERNLSEKLGVSRTALREALGRLRGMGIIATEHGKGSYVTRLSRDVDTSPLLHLFGTQPRTLKKIIDRQHQRLFAAIEAHDAPLAARVSREHIEGLKEMFMEIEQDEQRLNRAQMRLDADSGRKPAS